MVEESPIFISGFAFYFSVFLGVWPFVSLWCFTLRFRLCWVLLSKRLLETVETPGMQGGFRETTLLQESEDQWGQRF